ncbi:MAG: hypothetical protein ACPGLV_09055 [Bacteroidia bacterium]
MPNLIELNAISKKDGNDTYRIDLKSQGEGILGYRKAGVTFGGHYHTGESASKNPETLFLLSGVIELRTRDINTDQILKKNLTAPIKIEVPINQWHQLYAYTDVCFLELNSLEEHINDTKYE